MLYHVCCFIVGVMLNSLKILTVGMDGCAASEVNNHLRRLG
jgi:hypothetical protein